MCKKNEGPFPCSLEEENYTISTIANQDASLHNERNYDCKNYDTCLALTASLDWDGFTCHGCRGEINSTLQAILRPSRKTVKLYAIAGRK